MEKGNSSRLLLSSSVFVLFLVVLRVQSTAVVQARPLPGLNEQRYMRIVGGLGVVCKCCDGVESGGECSKTWESSCHKLQCHPWKF